MDLGVAADPYKIEPDILLSHNSHSDDEVFMLEDGGGDHLYSSNETLWRSKLSETTGWLILFRHTYTPRMAQLSVGQVVLNQGSVGASRCFRV